MSRPATMFSMQSLNGGEVVYIPNPDTDSADGLISTLVNSGRRSCYCTKDRQRQQ